MDSALRSSAAADLLTALNLTLDLPRAATCRLARTLGTWTASTAPAEPELALALGLPRRHLQRAQRLRETAADQAARERERAAALGATLITLGEAGYPPALLDLELPPPVLYCRGTIPLLPAVAVVGARRADAYALEVADWLGRELGAAGVLVVSGFARGVDAAAHGGALTAPQGTTVAVLGCGLDCDYPRGQRPLADRIAAHGALLSEFPIGTPPEAWRFPVRNRIIAALAAATVVVAAAPRSGSLVTARLALDLGREVFAVPGRIVDELALGPNALIRDGAALLQHPRDVLEALHLADAGASESGRVGAPAGESTVHGGPVLAALCSAGAPLPLDALVACCGGAVDAVLGELLELELRGLVRRLPGPAFAVQR